jgi:hypothetical protein
MGQSEIDKTMINSGDFCSGFVRDAAEILEAHQAS